MGAGQTEYKPLLGADRSWSEYHKETNDHPDQIGEIKRNCETDQF